MSYAFPRPWASDRDIDINRVVVVDRLQTPDLGRRVPCPQTNPPEPESPTPTTCAPPSRPSTTAPPAPTVARPPPVPTSEHTCTHGAPPEDAKTAPEGSSSAATTPKSPPRPTTSTCNSHHPNPRNPKGNERCPIGKTPHRQAPSKPPTESSARPPTSRSQSSPPAQTTREPTPITQTTEPHRANAPTRANCAKTGTQQGGTATSRSSSPQQWNTRYSNSPPPRTAASKPTSTCTTHSEVAESSQNAQAVAQTAACS